ncbi:MAG: response regulator [Betaproteobacteria bacterium]|nr:response regulator [Betaproteobacteria bacterium]
MAIVSRSHARPRFFPLDPAVASMSQNSTSSAPLATTALLLAQGEDFAVIDRRALREAGVGQVRVMTNGVYAARFLAGKEKNDRGAMPDVVLVHHQLADMTGADFVELVRSHPRLAGLPILHVSSSETPEEKVKSLAQGYSGLLVRPYSGESMRLALEYAAAVKADRDTLSLGRALLNTEFFDKALERFEAALDTCGQEPEKAFHSGLEQLQQRRWDEAISAFQQALKQLAFRGEAEFGIALAWKGKGDQQSYRLYLERAGHSFAQAAKWHRARTVYARLLQEAPFSESPFLLEAERLIRAGKFSEAATALAEGYELTSKGAIRERLARTLIYNSDTPEQDADALRRSLYSKAPEVADKLAEGVREEMDEQRRMRGRRQSAQTGSKSLFARGVPLLEEVQEETAFQEERGDPDRPAAIESLSEGSVTSNLFSDKPGVNEAITVAKLTWKIFRSGRL